MTMDLISWNIEELSSDCKLIKKQIDILEDNQRFLKKFASEVAESWQTPVGEVYSKHLNINTKDLKVILNQLEEFVRVLTMVRKDCYEKAEEDIKRRITLLQQSCD